MTYIYTTEKIRELARLAGSIEKLAHKIGVSERSVRRWAKGENTPKSQLVLDRLGEIEKELGGLKR